MNHSSNTTIEELLSERKNSYGDTWKLSGLIMGYLAPQFSEFLVAAPWMAHNWVLILSKMIRILFSPYNEDHWRDVIGYATLILNQLEADDEPTLVSSE